MDFRQTTQPTAPRPSVNAPAPVSGNKEKSTNKNLAGGKWFKILNLVILLGVAIIVAAVALAIGRGGSPNEYKYVNQDKYQAVFLNNGQVYFGNIQSLNSQYLRLENIYYLTQSSSTDSSSAASSGNYSLVKLGCQQIHDPYDTMLINRDQVTFWENLQDSGKVVTSINQFKKQNPKGPDCSQVSTQTQASSTGTQGATGNTGTTGTSSSTGTTTTTGTGTTNK